MPNGKLDLGGPDGLAVTMGELESVCEDTLNMFAERDVVINTHGECLGLHRAIFEHFFPKDRLEAVAAAYYKKRQAELALEEAPDGEAN